MENASSHSALATLDYSNENSIFVNKHPPHAPDLTMCDFCQSKDTFWTKTMFKNRYWYRNSSAFWQYLTVYFYISLESVHGWWRKKIQIVKSFEVRMEKTFFTDQTTLRIAIRFTQVLHACNPSLGTLVYHKEIISVFLSN